MSLRPVLAALAAAALAAAAGCAHRSQAAAAPDGATPLATARAFFAAMHVLNAQRAAELVDGPNAARATVAFVKMARAYGDLESAVRARYGPAPAREVGYAERVAAEDEALRAATDSVQGDRATVRAGGEVLATLRRNGGAWRVVLDEALASEAGVAALEREAEASSAAAAHVVPGIRGGLYDRAELALEAFRSEVALRTGAEAPDGEPFEPGEPDRARDGGAAVPL